MIDQRPLAGFHRIARDAVAVEIHRYEAGLRSREAAVRRFEDVLRALHSEAGGALGIRFALADVEEAETQIVLCDFKSRAVGRQLAKDRNSQLALSTQPEAFSPCFRFLGQRSGTIRRRRDLRTLRPLPLAGIAAAGAIDVHLSLAPRDHADSERHRHHCSSSTL